MSSELYQTIEQIGREKGIDAEIIIQAVEEAYAAASRKYYHSKEDFGARFDRETGQFVLFSRQTVVADEDFQDPVTEMLLEEALRLRSDAEIGTVFETIKEHAELPLTRIAAQAAKQVIFQKVRDAEQEKIYVDFAPRLGEIVTGVVRRIEDGAVILEVSRTEVLFPLWEKLPADDFRRGDMVKTVISQVVRGPKGPQIIVSRTSPRFLAKLLEIEVPEIANGTIVIKDIVRQAGERSKVAVASRERDIDPIGACIGVKGNRILAISKELGGEKVDIIEWSANIGAYARAALSPAKVERLAAINTNEKTLEAIVAKDQLSLAIGKKGINVKLASRLVGWKISITQEQQHE
jgi:N utilization substance protein A